MKSRMTGHESELRSSAGFNYGRYNSSAFVIVVTGVR